MSLRRAKLSKLLMEEIARLLSRELKDPRLVDTVITHVELSQDMSRARVYFTTLQEGKEEEAKNALEHAKAFIRAQLLKGLKIKKIPELEFVFDRELKRMERIWERL
ncbi:MAG: 30S ribosome-binding factor RbfA [Aquificaceae bacterium]|nr:30S ribosome-binding factor RbfA [Aquificaceae bacterium]MDW8424108.1 30S ribosome-binding factor RbfA [Aquificaceae bacterium]